MVNLIPFKSFNHSFPQPPSLSHLATLPHTHLAMATKPPQFIKASFTLFEDYDIENNLSSHSTCVVVLTL